MVQEVSAASETQDGVGQLKGEMSRLAELTGFSEAGGDKRRGSVRSARARISLKNRERQSGGGQTGPTFARLTSNKDSCSLEDSFNYG